VRGVLDGSSAKELLYIVILFALVSVRLYGATMSGTEVLPYVLSKNIAPAVPKPLTLEDIRVSAGFKLVVFEGASCS
jgi:hypothetical protein